MSKDGINSILKEVNEFLDKNPDFLEGEELRRKMMYTLMVLNRKKLLEIETLLNEHPPIFLWYKKNKTLAHILIVVLLILTTLWFEAAFRRALLYGIFSLLNIPTEILDQLFIVP